jgi:Cytochrome c7 and related cytochrome c/Class III cytochrome C family
MTKRLLTYLLLVGFVAALAVLGMHLRGYALPGNQEGYAPVQPIAFSHKQHAGDLAINCQYCHFAAEKSPHAGVPPANLCMNCHRLVTASWEATRAEAEQARQAGRPPRRIVSTELQKLYDALALGDDLQPDPNKEPQPVRWVKVHNLPQYTRFDHRAHVGASVACQECHGPVETMDVIRQSTDLSMGWCVRCHKDHREVEGRTVTPSTDCAICHY